MTTITVPRVVLEQALEALSFSCPAPHLMSKHAAAEAALRAALGQPEQEPVLVVEQEPDYMSRGHFYEGSKPFINPTEVWKLPIGTKLYTHPPQELTNEDVAQNLQSRLDAAKLLEERRQEIAAEVLMEREACADICDGIIYHDGKEADRCAAAIRARSKT